MRAVRAAWLPAALLILVSLMAAGFWQGARRASAASASQELRANQGPRPGAASSPIADPRDPAEPEADAGELIPRRLLFGNPERAFPKLSPEGKQLAYLAPDNGVLNLWIAPVASPGAGKPVTNDRRRGIRQYYWAFTSQHLLYLQDKAGDENWRVYCVDVATREVRDLTPLENVQARMQQLSAQAPNEVLIALNQRDARVHDLFRVNILTGERTLVAQNDLNFDLWITDDQLRARMGFQTTSDGGADIYEQNNGQWRLSEHIDSDDALTTSPIGFDRGGDTLYLLDSRGRNTAALVAKNLKTGERRLLAEDALADAGAPLIHPVDKTVQAVSFEYDRVKWRALDGNVESDMSRLLALTRGDFAVMSRTLDDKQWLVATYSDDAPAQFFRYMRPSGRTQFLFSEQPELARHVLARTEPVMITSRDGLKLVSYLTLPPRIRLTADHRPPRPLPMVLLVHGGPWARDRWGLGAMPQWLADRGYAVLSVNYRGSTGFGKNFLNAGDREWAGKMHDDLLDAVQWAIQRRIADPARIGIMGGSYGGYATLVGLAFTPDVFACGVDIVGPSNLVTLLDSIPPYWTPMLDRFARRVGDPRTEDGRALLKERSPLTRVDAIRKPLLIGQGANDPRVKQSESDQIVKALDGKGIPVTYVLYPDEGHGFARPENRLSFYAVTEAFLARHLGGRAEPPGDDLRGSSITVPTGAEHIPGLAETLRK